MTISKRGDRWQAQVYCNGKRIAIKTFHTKHEATRWEAERIANFSGSTEEHRGKTMENLIDTYRTRVMQVRQKPRTQTRNELDIARRILPFFQYRKVQSLTQGDYEDFLASLVKSGLSPKSQRHAAGLVASMFKKAEAWGWIARRPNAGVDLPPVPKTDYDWWDDLDHMKRFLDEAKRSCPRHYPAFLLACQTGMREGEICGLDRADVDLERGIIRIHRQWSDVLGEHGTTKTNEIRTLDISTNPILMGALRQAARDSTNIHALFTTASGKRIGNRELYHRFQNCVKRAGVPKIRFHDLRHTYASHFMRTGQVWDLKQVLGHTRIATTELYSHHAKGAAVATPLGCWDVSPSQQNHSRPEPKNLETLSQKGV